VRPLISRLDIGPWRLAGLSDGTVSLPRDYYEGVDWAEWGDRLAPSGSIDRPIGCFLIQGEGRTILVDTGVGARDLGWARGGQLLLALSVAGVAPSRVDMVVCTHLHADHIGWLFETEPGPFATAQIVMSSRERDWVRATGSRRTRDTVGRLARTSRLVLVGDEDALAPGVRIRATPGHTPGHISVVVSGSERRAFILGDVVVCPEEIGQTWTNTSDAEPLVAAATRATLWEELEATDDALVGAHFPALRFGVIRSRSGRPCFKASGPPPRSVLAIRT
jgi:glyoxylase-like metal-dependent hydrolase (beta-lactamase superfamily II)